MNNVARMNDGGKFYQKENPLYALLEKNKYIFILRASDTIALNMKLFFSQYKNQCTFTIIIILIVQIR